MLQQPVADPGTNEPFYIAAEASLAELKLRTLKHGDTFALFNRFGDLSSVPASPEGLYHEDTRFLSGLRLTIEDHPPLLLSSTVRRNNAVLDVDLTNPDLRRGDRIELPKDTFHISRMKFLWNAACYEVLAIRNFDGVRRRIRLALEFNADFKDIFEVRGFERTRRGHVTAAVLDSDYVRFSYASLDGVARATELHFDPKPVQLTPRCATFELNLAPRQRRMIVVSTHCRVDERPIERNLLVAVRSARQELRQASMRAAQVETSSTVLNEILSRGMADISMLVTDTEHGPYPYAGVPWFSTAFGRDGLLTAWQTLWMYPSLSRGVLRFLAATQATTHDPQRDAEPGKILHETRRCELARLGEVPFERYYGSIDSTPLFIALAGLYWQYTGDGETLQAIWPNIKAALAWIDSYGDIDGDGFVEYCKHSSKGLVNQGWKDSGDAVFHADGQLAAAPIALCEVQGYVYLARKMAARLATVFGEHALAERQEEAARKLYDAFNATFWDDELGMYVLALDGQKRPCRVRSSNAGHLLFTGIAPAERAAHIAHVLSQREFFTGWGIRTISASAVKFNPASYHNGSVWPHDNALIALGLARYGHTGLAVRLASAIFDTAAHMDLRRLPELFCGTQRRRDKDPVLYPVACAPQAWAAAAPFGLLQACLGLHIDAAQRVVSLEHPRLPATVNSLRISNLAVADARVDILLRRYGEDVAVNVLRRAGDVEVVVQV
jgi:glycogen debranching enzyme